MNSLEKVKGGGWVEKRRKNLARNVRHFYITELRENAFFPWRSRNSHLYSEFGWNFFWGFSHTSLRG